MVSLKQVLVFLQYLSAALLSLHTADILSSSEWIVTPQQLLFFCSCGFTISNIRCCINILFHTYITRKSICGSHQRQLRARPCFSSKPISAAAAPSQVFSTGTQHVSHTLVAAPAFPRDTALNSPVYLTVCPSNLLSLCVGLFWSRMWLHRLLAQTPAGPLRKPDIHGPGSSGSSCDETFTLSFVFYFYYIFYCTLVPHCKCLLSQLTL